MRCLTILFTILAAACGQLSAQSFTVTVEVTDATCSANGQASISVAGGSGDYRYLLEGDCGETFPAQTAPEFTTLAPCNYRVTVVDRQTNATQQATFVIQPNPEVLTVRTRFRECTGVVDVSGGAAPYTVSYSTSGGPMTTVVTVDSTSLGQPGDQLISGVVTDDCGNSRVFEVNGRSTTVRRPDFTLRPDSVVITTSGGVPPYTFTVTSTDGTVSNSTGIFAYTELGCDPIVSINSQCANAPVMREIDLRARLTLGCVNFEEGTLSLSVNPATAPPYTFTIETDQGTVVTTQTEVTGLPVGARSVRVSGEDACGNELIGRTGTTVSRLITPEPSESCTDSSLIVTVGRSCGGAANVPISVTCLTCPGAPVRVMEEEGERLSFDEGPQPGNYQLEVRDNCGDSFTCRDTVLLQLQPACDSIIATYVQRFVCDNATISRRAIFDPSLRFTLLDSAGNIVEMDNRNGRFVDLSDGTYTVVATGRCDTLRASATIGGEIVIDPAITIRPYNALVGDSCGVFYEVQIEKEEGPYLLEGIDDPSVAISLNDFRQNDCANFNLPMDLSPGRYQLTSLRLCGSKEFTLPGLDDLLIDSVIVTDVCPSGADAVVAAPFRTAGDWRNYFRDLGFLPIISSRANDYITVNGSVVRPDVIRRLAPGRYTIGVNLGFGAPECPTDTTTLVIPAYQLVELAVQGNFICDNTGTAELRLQPRFGNAPYELRRIECGNAALITQRFTLPAGDSATLTVPETGVYCFVVEDACGITADFQVEVRDVAESVFFVYDCAPAVLLVGDTLGGMLAWRDEAGQLLGTTRSVQAPPSLNDRTFTFTATTGTCQSIATLTVPGRPILPELSIAEGASEVIQCGTDSVLLQAMADDSSTVFWQQAVGGAAGAGLRIGEPGSYTAVATNDLGCSTTDSVTVRRTTPPAPTITPSNNFCPGEPIPLSVEAPEGASITWSPGTSTTNTQTATMDTLYRVTVVDTNACVGLDSFAVILPDSLCFNTVTDSVVCFGAADGALLVNASGGTGTLSLTINGDSLTNNELLTTLRAGSYRLQSIDANGCEADTTVSIGQPDSLQLDVGPDRFVVFGDSINLPLLTNAQRITAINVSNPLARADSLTGAITIRPQRSTGLTVTILNAAGCPAADSLFITVDDGIRLYAPNAFSPNGDGFNDRFIPFVNADQAAGIGSLRVYNRWGGEVFNGENLPANDEGAGWDGSLGGGKPAPTGVYVWWLEVRLFDGSSRAYSGSVTLLR